MDDNLEVCVGQSKKDGRGGTIQYILSRLPACVASIVILILNILQQLSQSRPLIRGRGPSHREGVNSKPIRRRGEGGGSQGELGKGPGVVDLQRCWGFPEQGYQGRR